MPTQGASIVVSPTPEFYFRNTNIGDLVVRGFNGGVSQKMLFGTMSNQDATFTIEPSNITTYNASFSMSNNAGQAQLFTSFSNIGVNKINPTAVLDVNGDVAMSSTLYAAGATTLSNALTVSGKIRARWSKARWTCMAS